MDKAEGTHAWTWLIPPDTAAGEAWAEFFAAWVKDSVILHNRWLGFTKDFWKNVENGEFGREAAVNYYSVNNWGDSCEGAVAGMLWDIHDGPDDDYSTFGDRVSRNKPDGVSDSLTLGIGDILSTLTASSRLVNGHHPLNIMEFWTAWNMAPSQGHPRAMGDIWYEHGDSTHFLCCRGTTGDLNMSGLVDMSDLSRLIAYLTMTPKLVLLCPGEADINASGDIDLADLSLLIAYFSNTPRPPLPPCAT